MNIYLILILSFYCISFVIDQVANHLNVKAISETIPDEFKDVYDADKYQKSQQYLRDNTRFDVISETFSLAVAIPFIVLGGFNVVDLIARSLSSHSIITGLIFFGILGLGSAVIGMPFTIYHTFVIEKKYGFNKTTVKTFVLDRIKVTVLSVVLGAPILAAILWFFETMGQTAWLWCWGVLSVLQLLMLWLVPTFIMPLFNKFEPLEEGELKTKINDYADKEKFKLEGIFKMDGSKRSTKSNAFFTGIGSKRRVVLFDTLIKNHTVSELVGVLAHEIGHYKRKHILKMLILSTLSTGAMFWILSLFLNNPGLFDAFKMENLSVYASLIFFAFLYSPIETVLGIFSHLMSRKHEYEADEFAVTTTKDPQPFINALKKLSVDNLSNLTPHPLKVFLEYSHPTVLDRIKAIKALPSK